MNLKKLAFIPLSLFTLSLVLSATVYEDGVMKNWKVDDNIPAGATVSSLKTAGSKSDINKHVIKLKGDGRSNAYVLTFNNSKKENILNFDMKFGKRFVFTLYIKTEKGERVLTFDHKNSDKGEYNQNRKKKYYGFGIGEGNGAWRHFSHDLDAELQKYEPNNKIVKVRSLKVRGSGEIDNVELTKDNGNENNNDLEKKFSTAEGQEFLKLAIKFGKVYDTKDLAKGVKGHIMGNTVYMAVDQQSKYSKNFLGLTYVDISDRNHIKVLGYTKKIFGSQEYGKDDLSIDKFIQDDSHVMLCISNEHGDGIDVIHLLPQNINYDDIKEFKILDTIVRQDDYSGMNLSLEKNGNRSSAFSNNKFYQLRGFYSEDDEYIHTVFSIENNKFHYYPEFSGRLHQEGDYYHNFHTFQIDDLNYKCIVSSEKDIKVYDCAEGKPTLLDTISF